MSETGTEPFKRWWPDAVETVAGELLQVGCGNCGWRGKRKAGNIVMCPDCGKPAAFQSP